MLCYFPVLSAAFMLGFSWKTTVVQFGEHFFFKYIKLLREANVVEMKGLSMLVVSRLIPLAEPDTGCWSLDRS